MKGLTLIVAALALLAMDTGAVGAPGGDPGKPDSQPAADNSRPTTSDDSRSTPPPPQHSSVNTQHRSSTNAHQRPSTRPQNSPARPQQSSGPRPSRTTATRQSASTRAASGPKATQNAGTGDNPQGRGPSGRTEFCHARGSHTNPYVDITTNNNALWAHSRHQDGRDIIPASGGCPGSASRLNQTMLEQRREIQGSNTSGDDQGLGQGIEGIQGIGGPGRGPANGIGTPNPQHDVLGAEHTGGPTAGNGVTAPGAGNVAEERSNDHALPFTGFAVLWVLLVAALSLGGGAKLRRIEYDSA